MTEVTDSLERCLAGSIKTLQLSGSADFKNVRFQKLLTNIFPELIQESVSSLPESHYFVSEAYRKNIC